MPIPVRRPPWLGQSTLFFEATLPDTRQPWAPAPDRFTSTTPAQFRLLALALMTRSTASRTRIPSPTLSWTRFALTSARAGGNVSGNLSTWIPARALPWTSFERTLERTELSAKIPGAPLSATSFCVTAPSSMPTSAIPVPVNPRTEKSLIVTPLRNRIGNPVAQSVPPVAQIPATFGSVGSGVQNRSSGVAGMTRIVRPAPAPRRVNPSVTISRFSR